MRRLSIALVLLAPALTAQQPAPLTLTGGALTPLHSAPSTEEGPRPDYGTWAAGNTYKASFHGGFEFIPYLGADYPENLPFAWHTESVRIEDREYATADAVGRRAADDRYEYDLGGVTEADDLTAESVEQTFTIHRAPTQAGGPLPLVLFQRGRGATAESTRERLREGPIGREQTDEEQGDDSHGLEVARGQSGGIRPRCELPAPQSSNIST